MSVFISIGDNYNPLTTQGEGNKIINVDHIVHVTDCSKMKNKVRADIKSRIYLTTGEYIDTVEPYDTIIENISKSE